MECHCIPVGELPGATLLYKAFLGDFSSVSGFYSHPPNLKGIQQAAAQIRLDDAMRSGVADVLSAQNRALGGDQATEDNLDRLRAGAVAVVTVARVTVAKALCTATAWYLRLFLVGVAPNERVATTERIIVQRMSAETEDTCNLFI